MITRIERRNLSRRFRIPIYLVGRNWEVAGGALLIATVALVFLFPYFYRLDLSSTPVPRDTPYLEVIMLLLAIVLFACWIPSVPEAERLSPRRMKAWALSNYAGLSVLPVIIIVLLRFSLGLLPLKTLQKMYGKEIFVSKHILNALISATTLLEVIALIGVAAGTIALLGRVFGSLATVGLWFAMVYGQTYFHSTPLPWPSRSAALIKVITPGGMVVAVLIWIFGALVWAHTKGGTAKFSQQTKTSDK